MRMVKASDESALAALAARGRRRSAQVEPAVRRIVDDVRRRGDGAVSRWTKELDGDLGDLIVSDRDLRRGWDATSPDVRRAIRLAARHLRKVAALQRARGFRVEPVRGVTVEQRVEPLRRVGCYVPAGRYPLPSTLLMTAVPARVAGVADVVVACPRPAPAVLAAALEAGVTTVYRVGGAQAVAALAYGTDLIPRVDKIVGPGSAWVAAAKRMVAGDCGVDLDAGPSEIVVWSSLGDPDWIAADLIAQAEHDPDARAIFVTTRARLAARVQRAAFQVGASSAQISAASKQMLDGAQEQARKTESSTAAVTELSASIQQVAENATEATRVARRRSPRQCHSAARSTRPPSIGKAGIRLKAPSSRLMRAR